MTLPGARTITYTFDSMGRQLTQDAPDTALSVNVGGGTSGNITRIRYYPTGDILPPKQLKKPCSS